MRLAGIAGKSKAIFLKKFKQSTAAGKKILGFAFFIKVLLQGKKTGILGILKI